MATGLLWTFGLPTSRVSRGPWQRAVFSRLVGRYGLLDQGDRTAEAESHLGITPPRAYFFVDAVVPAYGDILMLLVPSRPTSAQADVTPFDTGGLWFDHVRTSDHLDPTAKAALVHEHSYALDYPERFTEWRSGEFDDDSDYVLDVPPRSTPVPEIPVKGNDRHAWTWEARVVKDPLVAPVCVPSALVMRPADADAYLDWVRRDSPLQYNEKLDHLQFTKALLQRHPDPTARAMEMLTS